MNGNRKMIALGTVLLALGVVAGRALATGVPTQLPLTWSGTVTDETGAPYTTAVNVSVAFYDSPSSQLSKCTSAVTQAAANSGRFAVVLPPECAQAVHDTQDLWTETTVGPNNLVLPRAHVGAVPYALEADSATVAASAKNVTCTGCVTVDKMQIDKDLDLQNHNLTSTTGKVTAGTLSTGAAGANLTTGTLDLGPTVGDELTSAAVTTLTGGGNADALHTHAGLGTSIKFKGMTSKTFNVNAGIKAMNAQCATDYSGTARVCENTWLDTLFPAPTITQNAWILNGSEYQGGQLGNCLGFTTTSQYYNGYYLNTNTSVTFDSCDNLSASGAKPAACCGP